MPRTIHCLSCLLNVGTSSVVTLAPTIGAVERDINIGFYFFGMCIKNNALRCNNLNNAGDDGLNLWANGPISTKIGTQTNGGNKWLGAYGDFGAYNASITPLDILGSQFRIPNNQIPTWSTGLGQTVAWFTGIPITPINCLFACPLVVDTDDYPTDDDEGDYSGQGDIDNADITTAQNGHYGDGFNWMARQRLYERLKMYPALTTQNPYVQQFYNAVPYTDLGQLYEVGQSLRLLQGRDEYTKGALYELQADIITLNDSLQSLRAVGPGSNFNAWWLQVRLLQLEIKQTVNRLRGHENWLEGIRQAELPAILSANTSVTTTNICALNQRTINAIYAVNSLWKSNPLSATTLLQVKAIADQCPLDGGFAVYEARSLYRRFVPSVTWNENSGCTMLKPGARDNIGEVNSSLAYSIFPNPVGEELRIASNTAFETETSFELLNLMGQIIWESTILEGSIGASVSTRGIPSGVYLYRISQDKKPIQSGKLVISH